MYRCADPRRVSPRAGEAKQLGSCVIRRSQEMVVVKYRR
jgi:hypothetical protein